MSDVNHKFYMRFCDINGGYVTSPPSAGGDSVDDEDKYLKENKIDLEAYFVGLKYAKCEGLDTIGKPKNIYTETYCDAEKKRVYMPDNITKKITNEPTTITLTLYFVGENRERVMEKFNEYVRNGFHKYWDTARKKAFVFCIEDEISVSNELWYGSTPYIKCDYKLKNVSGKTDFVSEI